MKIALSSHGQTLEDELDLRFGRASGFIIFETNDGSFEYVDNEVNANASQGAGIQAGQNVANKNVEAVITGYCGPKAYNVLANSGVKIYNSEAGSVKDVIERFKNNELSEQID